MKTLRIDIYADIDESDIGHNVPIDIGEIRDMETGVVYSGKIMISNLVPIGSTEGNPFEDD